MILARIVALVGAMAVLPGCPLGGNQAGESGGGASGGHDKTASSGVSVTATPGLEVAAINEFAKSVENSSCGKPSCIPADTDAEAIAKDILDAKEAIAMAGVDTKTLSAVKEAARKDLQLSPNPSTTSSAAAQSPAASASAAGATAVACADRRDSFGGGTGTRTDPYLICNYEQFSMIRTAPSAYYLLAGDITISPTHIPIPTFRGSLYGSGFRILPSRIELSHVGNVNFALFLDNQGTIYGLQFSRMVVSSIGENSGNFATVAVNNQGTISNITGNIGVYASKGSSSDNYRFASTVHNSVGGIAAVNHGTITNASVVVFAHLDMAQSIGGIAGTNLGTIQRSDVVPDFVITGPSLPSTSHLRPTVGVIAGTNDGTITDSAALLNPEESAWSGVMNYAGTTGGIAGQNGGTITRPTVDISLRGGNICGGIAGMANRGQIEGALMRGATRGIYFRPASASSGYTPDSVKSGGVVGYGIGGAVRASMNTGLVVSRIASDTRNNAVGGLMGHCQDCRVEYASSTGDVSVEHESSARAGYAYAGGLLGTLESSSSGSASTAAGSASATRSSAKGRVYGYGKLGGFVGYNYGGIISYSSVQSALIDCMAGPRDMASSFSTEAAGFVAHNQGTITGSYTVASYRTAPSPCARRGGFTGFQSGTVSTSYFNSTTAGSVTAGGTAMGLTTSQMAVPASYSGWDFSTVWYPPATGRYPSHR